MIDLSTDFVVTNRGDGRWIVEQFYYIRPPTTEYDEETDTVQHIEPECGFRPVYEFQADSEAEAATHAQQWLRDVRERVIRHVFLNERGGGYFTGGWDSSAGQWVRPLDPEAKNATGCYAEFSKRPFPVLSYEDAIEDTVRRYGQEAVDRQLVKRIGTDEAERIYGVAPSSVTLACRSDDIAYANKRGRDWTFPTVTFLVWMDGRPGRGHRG